MKSYSESPNVRLARLGYDIIDVLYVAGGQLRHTLPLTLFVFPDVETCMFRWLRQSGISAHSSKKYEAAFNRANMAAENIKSPVITVFMLEVMMNGNRSHAQALKDCIGESVSCQVGYMSIAYLTSDVVLNLSERFRRTKVNQATRLKVQLWSSLTTSF